MHFAPAFQLTPLHSGREIRDVRLRYEAGDTINCRYPKDNKFLEIALSAKASAIITGDQDLLVLYPNNDIPIINAATFLGQ